MRIIVSKEEREAASKMKAGIITMLEAEGINASSQNPSDDYKKGISVFRDTQDNTVIDIKTAFIADIFGTFKKVGVLFIKTAIPFAKACFDIGKLLEGLDERWAEAPEKEKEIVRTTTQTTQVHSRMEQRISKRPIGFMAQLEENSKEEN
ncbi:hypothetical protein [Heyndrickxia sporothermodurans]|uniref:hypothetical protein n=1 Tax=Heyndrickxia sporothermodurans TaxID=46224 RepID=UPI000D3341D5|nr:hypothetical protein [Heyndrickxia sporothermodurans]PTY92916.1 hypothetical protein B5V90_02225 [Heyndrickxia sporothermodurans]